MTTLTLENLAKVFAGDVRAVDGLSLEAAPGEMLVLVGPSGCGKTTTLRMIAGLESPSGGSIAIDGRVVDDVPPKDRDVAMVFQHFALYPHMTVAGNMAFGLKMRRLEKTEIRRRVAEAADLLGIASLLNRRPGELSGGQRQRVALGRAIVRKPRLFLFDEPLSNLDAELRSQMRREIRSLHAALGATAVYVTHDQTEAMTLGRRIAVLREGRLQQLADPQTLYRQPANRFVAGLIGSPAMNFFAGRLQRGELGPVFATDGFTLPIPADRAIGVQGYLDRPITLGIRPEHLGSPEAERCPTAPRIPAKVEAVESIGPEAFVYLSVDPPNRDRQAMVMRATSADAFQVGQSVRPAVATSHLHFFDSQTGVAI